MLRLTSLCGLFAFLGLAWLLSTNRRAVRWRPVLVGTGLQIVLGLLFMSWTTGREFLQGLSRGVAEFLGLAVGGSEFVFGLLGNQEHTRELFQGFPPEIARGGFVFAFQVLPTIVFFSSFMAVVYHLGIMKWVVKAIAWVMVRLMGTSGSESLAVASNIFVGQTEAPLMVRPFLPGMTRSELMAVMTGGFATIAGGVFALYVGFGVDPGHLIIASVMSAPAALVVAKIVVPETEESETLGDLRVAMPKTASNVVEAAASGATDGLKLALNVAAMLIAFLGLIAVADWILAWLSQLAGITDPAEYWTLQKILGYLFAPLAVCLGVAWDHVRVVGELLGYKIAANELVAYQRLTSPEVRQALGWPQDPRSFTIATFALCGFANFASIAIQIGGIAALAPERRSDLARLGLRAMIAGALASWMTAAVVGILV